VAGVQGFVSAPRERRTSRDAQFLFVNGRFVRDRLIGRALSEGYRSILPHGVYPAALLFVEVPLEEVDVNVHPAKTEVRFRRAAAVADAVREAVRAALASAGYVATEIHDPSRAYSRIAGEVGPDADEAVEPQARVDGTTASGDAQLPTRESFDLRPAPQQERIAFGVATAQERDFASAQLGTPARADRDEATELTPTQMAPGESAGLSVTIDEYQGVGFEPDSESPVAGSPRAFDPDEERVLGVLPPLNSADKFVREVPVESLTANIRPLGQLDESFIIATDDEGLLLIDQHVAHERILFDKYRALEASRPAASQQMLIPETFDLTPAQAAAFDVVATELEAYGFELMRLSGRTVAIKSAPADLPPSEARNMLAEVLDTVDSEKRGAARATLRDDIAASLACHAAIKVNMPLAPEKMRWLIDRLLRTSSPTTCPHGRPVILRLTTQDILKGFHRI